MLEALHRWLDSNVELFEQHGVLVETRFPAHSDSDKSKANLSLRLEHIACDFTAWSNSRWSNSVQYESSLIVFNSKMGETLLFDDKVHDTIEELIAQLDEAKHRLVSREYHGLNPDPKLIIR